MGKYGTCLQGFSTLSSAYDEWNQTKEEDGKVIWSNTQVLLLLLILVNEWLSDEGKMNERKKESRGVCLETLVKEMKQGGRKKKWGNIVWWLLLWGSWLHIMVFPFPKTFERKAVLWDVTKRLNERFLQQIARHAEKSQIPCQRLLCSCKN